MVFWSNVSSFKNIYTVRHKPHITVRYISNECAPMGSGQEGERLQVLSACGRPSLFPPPLPP